MNAKLLERLISFRKQHGLAFTKTILKQKIIYQFSILNKRKLAMNFTAKLEECGTLQRCMLVEAHAAKVYWTEYGKKVSTKIDWSSRRPREEDCFNKLIDIGYHYLTVETQKLFEKVNLPFELGVFHKAQSGRSTPLVYDFIEWLRPIVVDRTLLKFLRKKKTKLEEINGEDISYFLLLVKKEYKKLFYHKDLKYCITLEYWIKLVALRLIGSINESKEFDTRFPSLRNETRCGKQK